MNFKNIIITILLIFFAAEFADAQYRNAWMSAGSLHNWYSEIGSELEEMGFVKTQQSGMQWPAIYPYQDMQAARGFWVGSKDFTDARGNYFPHKVAAIGPRPPAYYPSFPLEFKMVSKFELPVVTVDNLVTLQKDVTIDEIDENMLWDRMIINEFNTELGITVTRKIFQFSQQFNDNYIVYDFTFKNTGNTDGDPDIEFETIPTLQDVYFFWTFRNSVNKQTRYVIGNNSGWGINNMNDFRGDGVEQDPANEQFRAQFSWHGYYTDGKEVGYDNIGGPIWNISANARPYFEDQSDTTGRLGATQFLGTVTLHADRSSIDVSDDPGQPSTTNYLNSDDKKFLAGADARNTGQMTEKYEYMASGHQAPRHARLVEPTGDYATQKAPPNVGNASGGISYNIAYGPYTMAAGEDVHIVFIEAAAGMSREEQIRIGKLFKNGAMTAIDKNREVMKSRDSLFQTFRRAIESFNAGWNIPQPPLPPSKFDVSGGGDRIRLTWTAPISGPAPSNYNIYRAEQNIDSTYRLIATVDGSVNTYDDLSPTRGVDYYYYLSSVGSSQGGGAGTPAGTLESSRYYTQTYDPARLKRPAGKELSDIRIVPNPFVISGTTPSSSSPGVRYPGDRIGFLNIPGNCTIRIYTELGELIKTIEHTDGSGDEFWESVTSSNQIVVSGIYIAVITDNVRGENFIEKFAVIR